MARAPARRKRTMWRAAFLLVTPFAALYLVFFLYPTYRIVQLSLTDAPLIGPGNFVGLENFQRLLGDALFLRSLRNTFYFVLLSVVPNTALGLVFALMVVRLRSFRSTVLAAFFLPYMLPVSVVTLIWQWLLNTQFGIVQRAFGLFGEGRVALFSSPTWAMPTVAFVTVWWTVGFNMLLFIAGLQGISKEYYEAAALDGATDAQTFRHITWPLLWPITALVLTLQLIAQLKIFDQIYLLTNGGPFNTTLVTLLYMYRQGFQSNNGGYAATVAVALFVIILFASLVQVRLLGMGARK